MCVCVGAGVCLCMFACQVMRVYESCVVPHADLGSWEFDCRRGLDCDTSVASGVKP